MDMESTTPTDEAPVEAPTAEATAPALPGAATTATVAVPTAPEASEANAAATTPAVAEKPVEDVLMAALGELTLRKFVVGNRMHGQSPKFAEFSQYESLSVETQARLLKELRSSASRDVPTPLSRATAALVGLAIADAAGHPFEFMPVVDKVGESGHIFDIKTLSHTKGRKKPLNRFNLKPGQWTDDASMALCMADSLVAKAEYNGSDIRTRFWNWWFCGYNTAFKNDNGRRKTAVGLGGNISKSIYSCAPGANPHKVFQSEGEDAGNGSLMRLAPIPIFFSADEQAAINFAKESSYTTHPGPIAAECCGFVSFLTVAAINSGVQLHPRVFLEMQVARYQKLLQPRATENGVRQLLQLLASDLPERSTERCWNWKAASLNVKKTLRVRGRNYNGYPVSAGYHGAFSMDGLAIALYCVYNTATFAGAIERVVNFMGDADSTGAIVGQLAGAIYGYESIPDNVLEALQKWDDGSVTLRAIMLFKIGRLSPAAKADVRRANAAQEEAATDEADPAPVGTDSTGEAAAQQAILDETQTTLLSKLQEDMEGGARFLVAFFQARQTQMVAASNGDTTLTQLETVRLNIEYRVAQQLVQQLAKQGVIQLT